MNIKKNPEIKRDIVVTVEKKILDLSTLAGFILSKTIYCIFSQITCRNSFSAFEIYNFTNIF